MTLHTAASTDAISPAATPAILAKSLSFWDGDDLALGPIDFAVAPGTGLVVDGDDIRARRTLLSLILGEPLSASGVISVFDRDPRGSTDPDVTGYVTEPTADPDITVTDRLEAIASRCSVPDSLRATAELLDELGIAAVAERFGLEMSAGQAQLVQIASALIRPSRMVVLDEPERRLDVRSLRRLIDALARRRAEGTTLVIASHSPMVVEHLGDTILHLGEVD